MLIYNLFAFIYKLFFSPPIGTIKRLALRPSNLNSKMESSHEIPAHCGAEVTGVHTRRHCTNSIILA